MGTEICLANEDMNASVSQLFPKGYGTANIVKTCSKRKSLLSQMQMLLLLEESLESTLEAITQRCIRVVGTLEPEIGGCALCSEKEYHVGCLKEHNIDDLKELPEADWFCCTPCKNINSALQKLIGDGEQRLPEALSDVLKMKSEGQDLHKNPELGIRWRLLHGKKATEDCRVWLSGAVNIFHDRFDPISDSSTGRLDLIPHMVYGRRFKDQDFCGMYCAVLMVGSVVVSAAIFRIFGEEVAEVPLVATRSECQGKHPSMKDLVLPAADEAESLWRNRFGFQTLGQEQIEACCSFVDNKVSPEKKNKNVRLIGCVPE
ncbi:UNVERIFIED_CONTAM: hypothetical protein Sangu_2864900 [Sesamum angustifolium]|uniref:Increased DNA methylation 1 C-terminal domain-containing protein n=1 Tax=Sesamum angustifolium TaxID=2727405 RepID=A0AAW2IPM7_9LAMI